MCFCLAQQAAQYHHADFGRGTARKLRRGHATSITNVRTRDATECQYGQILEAKS